MWLSDLPEPVDHLKQGDLLVEVPLPSFSKRPERDATGKWNLKLPSTTCLVVSQDCTVAQRSVVQVVNVYKTAALAPTHPMFQALRSDWPAAPGALMYDAMRLDPLEPMLPALDEGRLWFADFRTGVTFTNAFWLVEHLRGRMTVVAKRNLRMRLGAFYARPTEEDRAELAETGEWAGFGDAPVWIDHKEPPPEG